MDAVGCHVVFGKHADEVVLLFVADVEWAGAELCVGWDFVAEPVVALFDGAADDEVPCVVGAVEKYFYAKEVLTGYPRGMRGFEASVACIYEGSPHCGVLPLVVFERGDADISWSGSAGDAYVVFLAVFAKHLRWLGEVLEIDVGYAQGVADLCGCEVESAGHGDS